MGTLARTLDYFDGQPAIFVSGTWKPWGWSEILTLEPTSMSSSNRLLTKKLKLMNAPVALDLRNSTRVRRLLGDEDLSPMVALLKCRVLIAPGRMLSIVDLTSLSKYGNLHYVELRDSEEVAFC